MEELKRMEKDTSLASSSLYDIPLTVTDTSDDRNNKKKPCCKDEFQVFSGQNQLDIKSPLDISNFNEQFIAVFFEIYSNLYKSLPKRIIPNPYYEVPVLVMDIQMIDQVFLI